MRCLSKFRAASSNKRKSGHTMGWNRLNWLKFKKSGWKYALKLLPDFPTVSSFVTHHIDFFFFFDFYEWVFKTDIKTACEKIASLQN